MTIVAGSRLDRSMVRAVGWNATAKWVTQILSWVSTIAVARLLAPSDYGLVGMAGLYLGLAMLISQVGIADAVISLRYLTHRQMAELNTVATLMGALLVAISCILAVPLARLFSAPQLLAVVSVSSLVFGMNGFQVVPRALLQKELKFSFLAFVEIARTVSQVLATVVLAWFGFRYWSLIYGQIVGCAVATGLILWSHYHQFAFPGLTQLRHELRFSGNMLVTGIGWYVYSNADFFVAGRVLGQVPLGEYSVAWTISSAPIEKIGNLVTNATPAFFSVVQHDKAELRRYLLRLSEMLSYATVPASLGLALLGDYLVPVLLGPKWVGVIRPLQLLGVLMAFRSLTILPGRVLAVTGETGFAMWTTVAAAIIMPTAFFIASRWGTIGIATAWIVVYPPVMLPVFLKAFQRIDLKAREYISSVMPALSSSVIMSAAVFVARLLLGQRWTGPSRLLVLVALGAAIYCGALYEFHRKRVSRIVRVFHSIRSQ